MKSHSLQKTKGATNCASIAYGLCERYVYKVELKFWQNIEFRKQSDK